jgi:hypothetical protein
MAKRSAPVGRQVAQLCGIGLSSAEGGADKELEFFNLLRGEKCALPIRRVRHCRYSPRMNRQTLPSFLAERLAPNCIDRLKSGIKPEP